MIKFLIERPVSVVMVFIAIVVLGLISFQQIPISLLPDVEIPEITVQVFVPEKSAKQIEENYISAIRRQMLQVGHLEDIESYAFNESGYIRLKFDYGAKLHYAFIEVNEKIDALMQSMPDDFERPRVIKASATDIPAFYMTIVLKGGLVDGLGDRFMELSEFSEQVIKRRIEQLDEVAMVDISGMEYPEIQIEVDLRQLDILKLSPWEIENTLKNNNLTASNIKVRNGIYEFNVKYSSILMDRHDIEQLVLKSGDRIFQLSEVAKISVVAREGKGFILDKRGKAISMAVIKKSNARMENLKQSTQELIEAIKKDYPRVEVEVNRNQTELLDYSISNLKSSLIVGGILAFLILFLFLKDLRSPLLIGISVPVSLIVSFLFFYLFDISINVISLSGLIVGLGLMIDNSIIVIDNIVQHAERKDTSLVNASANATIEVIGPLITSALTTCAVFVPLIFLGGIAGALFYDQALSISIGLASSFIISITLIPVLYVVFAKKNFSAEVKHGGLGAMTNLYEKGFHWVDNNRKTFISLTLLLLISGVAAYFMLDKERFPAFDQTEVIAEIDWNQNITKVENGKRVTALIQDYDSLLQSVSAMVGEQWYLIDQSSSLSGTQANIYFQCRNQDDLQKFKISFENWMRRHYPVAAYKLNPTVNMFERVFGSNQPPLQVRLASTGRDPLPSPEELVEISDRIKMEAGIATDEKHPLQEVYEIHPKFDRLLLYDVASDKLIATLRTAFSRFRVFELKQGQYEVPVVLTQQSKDLYSILVQTQVRSNKNALISVSELVDVRKSMGYKGYQGGIGGAFAVLAYDVADHQTDALIDKISNVINDFPLIDAAYTGSILQTRALLSELWLIFLVSLLLLYFILASQFESLLQPFIVFLEIPIDVASALLFLWLFGESLNLLSLIGIIVMSGIVINDSILKIDTINRLRKQGNTIDAAIQLAGKRRLKPILMTSATTILAMTPFLWGGDMGTALQRPLAVAVIGGMLIGTFVSLYFIPIAYRFIYQKSISQLSC